MQHYKEHGNRANLVSGNSFRKMACKANLQVGHCVRLADGQDYSVEQVGEKIVISSMAGVDSILSPFAIVEVM